MVKIVVGNIYSKIVGHLPDEVSAELDTALSYRIHNAIHMPLVKEGKWDGIIRLYMKNRGQSYYTGLMSYVREILNKHKIEFQIGDTRVIPPQNLPGLTFTPPPWFQERDYQAYTIERSHKFTRGILELATGGGKTMVVTKLIASLKTYPFVFYVLTKDLMEQACDVMSSCLNEPIGRIGDGTADIQKINVCTIQTAVMAINQGNPKFKISDYQFDDEDAWDEKSIANVEKLKSIKDLVESASGIYVDEAHHVSARTCIEVLKASKNAYWRYGGTATPYRETGDEIMIQAMFGAKIVSINASFLIKKGILVKPYVFFEPIDSANEYHSYKKIYDTCIVHNDKFNDHVADTANHLVQKGLSVLILVQHFPQGDYLESKITGSAFLTSRISLAKRKDMLDKLRSREIKVIIGTSLLDEGVDVPCLDAVIMAGGGASCTRVNQRIGRALRVTRDSKKDRAVVVIYEHNAKYLSKQANKIRVMLKKEPEFVIRKSKGINYICDEIDSILGVDKEKNGLFES